jgi:hypothetical protein
MNTFLFLSISSFMIASPTAIAMLVIASRTLISGDIKVWQTSPFKAGLGFGSLWFLTFVSCYIGVGVVHLWVKCLKG